MSRTSHKRLLADSSKSGGGTSAYVTYRSCIPAINEEKLSVLGFEVITPNFMPFKVKISLFFVYYRINKVGSFTISFA